MTETEAPPHGDVAVDAAVELDAVGADAIDLAREAAEATTPATTPTPKASSRSSGSGGSTTESQPTLPPLRDAGPFDVTH